jgi:Spy/CpxP family protein refolding chaperone
MTEDALSQLLQNCHELTPEQQQQLQQLLKTRWKKELKSQKKM